ncbi:MAG: helix-turn-helix domain-containing protein [Capsulimonadaceae bacterium]|nr:helix-turn-helix domain-containing protein [Capsulimonadaceae bacterium]
MATLTGWLNEAGNRKSSRTCRNGLRGPKMWAHRPPERSVASAAQAPVDDPHAGRKGGRTQTRRSAVHERLQSDEAPSSSQGSETRDELISRLLDPTLTLEETAQVLNVCPTTVRRYTNRGNLPHFRTAGNQRRFRLSEVLAFLRAQEGAPATDAQGADHSGHTGRQGGLAH